MKMLFLCAPLLFIAFISCNEESKYDFFRRKLEINLSDKDIQHYIDMSETQFDNEITAAIQKDGCENESMGPAQKRIAKIDLMRRLFSNDKIEMDNEINKIKEDYKLRKSFICF